MSRDQSAGILVAEAALEFDDGAVLREISRGVELRVDDVFAVGIDVAVTSGEFHGGQTAGERCGGFKLRVDDHFAGGGGATDGVGIQSFSNYTESPTTIPASFWNDHYQGIFRANILLQKLPAVDMSDALKSRFAAEAKALRALYYFNLVRMFKNIPLILEPLTPTNMYEVLQASPADVYTQIENDLTEAINDLPASLLSSEIGRLNKGAAQALLGKVYLYDGKNTQAAAILAEVNGTPGSPNQYGNYLLTNYNDLWVVNNKFNAESIWEVAHASTGSSHWGVWGSGSDEGNSVNVMVGPRGYVKIGSTAPSVL